MVLKNVLTAIVCSALFAWSGLSMADEYRPGEFLGLDLSQAVLSPKLLGPTSEFAPVPVEARADRGEEGTTAHVERTTHARTRAAHTRAEKPRGTVRAKLARRHGNPLDAQAMDARIQVWPCKSGGICNWQHRGN
jgi:hypothetical protein